MANFKRNPDFMRDLQAKAARRVTKAAEHIHTRIRTELATSGSGFQHPGKPNRSSAPGESPVTQSGELEASHRTFGPVITDKSIIAGVASDDIKSRFLQLGTMHAAPRPYMKQALEESRPQVMQAMGGKNA